ncbi:MAG: hypothetical protein IKF16_09125 [Lachnospiraceae bacterium]|nr:hypothetical protein [Lachnospiraceae bacterium]
MSKYSCNNKKVTQEIYDAAKALVKGGYTYVKAASVLGISRTTIQTIMQSINLQDYFDIVNAKDKPKPEQQTTTQQKEQKTEERVEKVIVHEQTVKIEATHYMMEELRKANESLKLISNKLCFIVDELTK